MNIEVRIYKRFDTDLLALYSAGYSLTRMIQDALVAYATGKPFHIMLEDMEPFVIKDKNTLRVRVNINESVHEVSNLLKKVAMGYKSNFCKQVLRNAIIQQNLTCYFSDVSAFDLHAKNRSSFETLPGTIMVSSYRHRRMLSSPMAFVPQGQGYNLAANSGVQGSSNDAVLTFGNPINVQGQLMIPVTTAQGIQLVPVPVPAAAAQSVAVPASAPALPDAVQKTDNPIEEPAQSGQLAASIEEEKKDPPMSREEENEIMAMFDAI